MLQNIPTQVPVIGQREARLQAGIAQAVQQLSMAIYTQAVASLPNDTPIPILHSLAQYSMNAAKAYFQGLGIAQFNDPPTQP